MKAYARKPVGNPTANLIAAKHSRHSSRQNGIPNDYWTNEFAPAESKHRAERDQRDLDYEWERNKRREQFESEFYGNGEQSESGASSNDLSEEEARAAATPHFFDFRKPTIVEANATDEETDSEQSQSAAENDLLDNYQREHRRADRRSKRRRTHSTRPRSQRRQHRQERVTPSRQHSEPAHSRHRHTPRHTRHAKDAHQPRQDHRGPALHEQTPAERFDTRHHRRSEEQEKDDAFDRHSKPYSAHRRHQTGHEPVRTHVPSSRRHRRGRRHSLRNEPSVSAASASSESASVSADDSESTVSES